MVLLYIIFSFDNMFQNAFKCDMVSTTCSKMPSNATWFRQHVPKCSQMRHGFDNMFQTYQTYQPTNLPTYIYIYIYFLCMHNTLVHAQHSCACTGGARAQGQDPTKKRPPGPARGGLVGLEHVVETMSHLTAFWNLLAKPCRI